MRISRSLIHALMCALTVTLCVGANADNQLLATATYGYDSNPFKLSSPEGTESGAQYKTLLLKYQGDNQRQGSSTKANLRYSADLQKQLYSHSISAGDSSILKGHISWIERFKLAKRKANLRLSADLRSEQNTYYSQIQRQVAETGNGDLMGDRFSFDSLELSAELTYYQNKKTSWSLLSRIGQRDYQSDYEDIGLEPLDYDEFRLQPGLRYKADSGLNARLFVYHKSRRYKGLHNGPDNDSSLVEYSLNGYGLVLSKSFKQRIDTSVYFSGYFARDNGMGIRDLDFHKLVAKFNYQLGDDAEITVKAEAYWQGYLDLKLSPEESQIGSSGNSRRGTVFELGYSRSLASEAIRGSIYLRREYEENALVELGYQRQIVAIGLHYQL